MNSKLQWFLQTLLFPFMKFWDKNIFDDSLRSFNHGFSGVEMGGEMACEVQLYEEYL